MIKATFPCIASLRVQGVVYLILHTPYRQYCGQYYHLPRRHYSGTAANNHRTPPAHKRGAVHARSVLGKLLRRAMAHSQCNVTSTWTTAHPYADAASYQYHCPTLAL